MKLSRVFFFVLYTLMELSSIAYVYLVDTCVSWEWLYRPHIYHPHMITLGIYAFLLNGRGMIIFRLLPGIKTQSVKTAHVVLHTMSLLVGYLALHCDYYIASAYISIYKRWRVKTYHFQMYMVIAALYHIQCITGWLFFYNTSQRLRKLFAPLHSFLGIVVFYLVFIVCSTAQYTVDNNKNYEIVQDTDLFYATAAGSAFAILVIGILIYPHFEWPLVGPL